MLRHITFHTDAGGKLLLEIRDDEQGVGTPHDGTNPITPGCRESKGVPERVEKPTDSEGSVAFEAAMDVVRESVRAFLGAFRDLDSPDILELSFGLTATRGGDLVVTKSSGEVNYNVKIVWDRSSVK
jgi:hypothetical protein